MATNNSDSLHQKQNGSHKHHSSHKQSNHRHQNGYSRSGRSSNGHHSHGHGHGHSHRSGRSHRHQKYQVLNPFELYMAARSQIEIKIGTDPENPVNAQPNFYVGDVIAGKISSNRNYVRMRVLAANHYKQWIPLKIDNKTQVLRVFPPKMVPYNHIEIGRSTKFKVKQLSRAIYDACETNFNLKVLQEICYEIVEYVPFLFPIMSVCSTVFRGRGTYSQFSVPFFHKKDHCIQYFRSIKREHRGLARIWNEKVAAALSDRENSSKSVSKKNEFIDNLTTAEARRALESYKKMMETNNDMNGNASYEHKSDSNGDMVFVNHPTNDDNTNDNTNNNNNNNTNNNNNNNGNNNGLLANMNPAQLDPNVLNDMNNNPNRTSDVWVDNAEEDEELKRMEDAKLDRQFMEDIIHAKKGELPKWILDIYKNIPNKRFFFNEAMLDTSDEKTDSQPKSLELDNQNSFKMNKSQSPNAQTLKDKFFLRAQTSNSKKSKRKSRMDPSKGYSGIDEEPDIDIESKFDTDTDTQDESEERDENATEIEVDNKIEIKYPFAWSNHIYYNCELYAIPNDYQIDFTNGEYLEQNGHRNYTIESETFDRKWAQPIKMIATKNESTIDKLIDLNYVKGSRWFDIKFDRNDPACEMLTSNDKWMVIVGGNWNGDRSRHYFQLTDENLVVRQNILPMVLINACVSCRFFNEMDTDDEKTNDIETNGNVNNSSKRPKQSNGHHSHGK